MHYTIREFHLSDQTAITDLIIYLQEYERSFEPEEKMPGEEIADDFLKRLLRENTENQGKMFLAVKDTDGKAVGFCNAWIESQPEEECLSNQQWLYISDLAVLPEHQGVGVGRLLISAAEDYGKELNLKRVQLGVLARSSNSRQFYAKCGFREFEVTLLKEL
jgi:mycothiol synthase